MDAGIAQLVEQRIRNAWVVGSNPLPGSILPLDWSVLLGVSILSVHCFLVVVRGRLSRN